MAKRVCHGTLKCWAEFYGAGPAPGYEQTLFLPDVATHGGKGVAECRALLSIPSRCRHATLLGWLKAVCK